MQLLGFLEGKVRWDWGNGLANTYSHERPALLKIYESLPSYAKQNNMHGDPHMVFRKPVFRVRMRLAPLNWGEWLFTLEGLEGVQLNLKQRWMHKIVTMMLERPREVCRGDGTIRTEIVVYKRGA
jgi:hypothetical protein